MRSIRVRSNAGTWKFPMEGSQTIQDVLEQIQAKSWSVTAPLSRDPSGKEKLEVEQSLEKLGLEHGSMLYCRVQELQKTAAQGAPDGARIEKVAAADDSAEDMASKKRKRERTGSKPVIDLLDSSDDEELSQSVVKSNAGANLAIPLNSYQNGSSKAQVKGDDSEAPALFQVASYNVWFGPPDPTVQQVHAKERMLAIAEELQTCTENLMFVGFQELTSSLRLYLEPHLKQMGYRFCTQPLGDAYGVGLAMPNDINVVETKFLPFENSTQGRGLLYVQTPTLLFGTTHLESFVDAKTYDGAQQRERQLVQAAGFCEDRMKEYPSLQTAMIAGDLNWDDERKRSSTAANKLLLSLLYDNGCDKKWKDAGKPFDYTYDAKENPMLGGNLRRRFDRCLYLTQTTHDVSLRKIGTTAIPNLSWEKKNPYNGSVRTVQVAPSDHFGIVAKFHKV